MHNFAIRTYSSMLGSVGKFYYSIGYQHLLYRQINTTRIHGANERSAAILFTEYHNRFFLWDTLQLLSIAPVWQLIIGVIEGTAIYTGIAYIFKFKEFQELADIIHKR